MSRQRFVIGMNPDLARIEQEPDVAILEQSDEAGTWLLLRVPADRSVRVMALFRGISHAYETEEEAGRVWGLFGK